MNTEETFWSRVDQTGECWNYVGPKRNGYGLISVNKRSKSAHRYSYRLNVGEIPEGMHVLHSCDNPSCVNPEHLSLGTHAENMVDMYRKNRGNNKLTIGDIPVIREMLKRGDRQIDIAERFGVSRRCISKVKTGATWAHA